MKFKAPFNLSLGKLLYSKRFTVPFSIIFAFVFWLVITIVQNPTRNKTFSNLSVTVPISDNTFLAEEKLNIVSDFSKQTFTVEVSGPNYLVSSLSSEDFLLVASLDEVISAGTFSLKVNGVANSSKSGYTFVSVTPATVDVAFDYIDTKEFSMKPVVSDIKISEGYIAENPVLTKTEQARIEITGPRSIINKIKTVSAVAKNIGAKSLQKTTVYPASIVLYDENDAVLYEYANDGTIYDGDGKAVSNNYLTLSVKPSDVSITYPVYKEVEVPLVASFINLPSGVTRDMIVSQISPQKIKIYSADPPSEIALAPIDWSKVTRKNYRFTRSAVLPDGVKTREGILEATVTVNYNASLNNIS